jgi:hypothetical protein
MSQGRHRFQTEPVPSSFRRSHSTRRRQATASTQPMLISPGAEAEPEAAHSPTAGEAELLRTQFLFKPELI